MKSALLRNAMLMLLAGSLVGCASTARSPVRVQSAGESQPACNSFSWLATQQQPASLTDQRVQATVMSQLQTKGYTASEQADCRITYILRLQEGGRSGPSVGVGAGGGSGGVGGGIGVSLPLGGRKQAGTFTLDVVDAARNAQVWSGALDVAFSKDEPTEREIADAVGKVLAKYPDRGTP